MAGYLAVQSFGPEVGRRAPRAAHPAGRLRLTRRGRVVRGVVLAAVVAALLALAAALVVRPVTARAAAPEGASVVEHPRPGEGEWVVLPGETLWGIARSWSGNSDPREVVSRIVLRNQLDGSRVSAGQRLILPAA